jgi:hypothetical protein
LNAGNDRGRQSHSQDQSGAESTAAARTETGKFLVSVERWRRGVVHSKKILVHSPKNSENSEKNPKKSGKFKKIQKNQENLKKSEINPENLQKSENPKKSEKYPKNPKKIRKILKNPKNPNNPKIFKTADLILQKSEKNPKNPNIFFAKNPKNQKNPRKNPKIFLRV